MAPVVQTRYPLQVWGLCNPPVQGTVNDRFQNNGNFSAGYGPGTFTVGVSTDGVAPADAYITNLVMPIEDIAQLTWLTSQAALSKCWWWFRAREDVLNFLVNQFKSQLGDEFDSGEFQDENWLTRSKGYVKLGNEGPINDTLALGWIQDHSSPQLNLQIITG